MTADNRPAIQPGAPLPALLTAGVVAGALLVIEIVGLLFGQLATAAYYGYLPGAIGDLGWSIGVFIVPFALGVFLSLWLVFPVRPGQKLLTVLVRGLLASTAGAVLAGIVAILASFARFGLFHDLFPTVVGGVLGIVSTAVANAPLVMLVLVVQHLVLTRATPASGHL